MDVDALKQKARPELERIVIEHPITMETVETVWLIVSGNVDLTRAICAVADYGVTPRRIVKMSHAAVCR